MKKLIFASMFAAGMLATPMLATAAGASGATNSHASCIATSFAGSPPPAGVGLGTEGNPFAPIPYGQVVKYVAQGTSVYC